MIIRNIARDTVRNEDIILLHNFKSGCNELAIVKYDSQNVAILILIDNKYKMIYRIDTADDRCIYIDKAYRTIEGIYIEVLAVCSDDKNTRVYI